jgi:peptidoglycan-N-acetylglucosamine deacetylase
MRFPLALAIAALFTTTAAAQSHPRTVAITIDDLPCAYCGLVNADGSSQHGQMLDTNRRLVDKLKAAHIPITGFVITGGAEDPNSTAQQSLKLWLDAGFELGSHSNTHPDFNDLTPEAMEAEITQADATLRPLLAAHGRQLQFFRYPFNHTGDTTAKHDAVAAFLKDHNYQVATCTIENEDYVFAPAYSRALGTHDLATAARIRREYLDFTAAEIDYYAKLNTRVLGYEPPEVMLLHDSYLNADTIDDVLALFRTRGYQFTSLAQAQADPAYATPDTDITRVGPMWGYRWAQERHLGRLGMADTEPPDWITDYAQGKPTTSTTSSSAPTQTPQDQAVLAPIQAMFDGMAHRDAAAIKAQALPGTILILMRDGNPAQMTVEAFADRVAQPSKTQIEERIHDPLIRIDNDLAVVWAPFDFLIDGKVNHCGTDVFHLVRTANTWHIAAIADTSRNTCPGSST